MNAAYRILRKHLADHASISLKGWEKVEPKKIEAILLAMEEYKNQSSNDIVLRKIKK